MGRSAGAVIKKYFSCETINSQPSKMAQLQSVGNKRTIDFWGIAEEGFMGVVLKVKIFLLVDRET